MTIHSLRHDNAADSYALTLVEMKNFLKIDCDEDDSLILNLIKAATKKLENYTGLAILKQKWVATYSEDLRQCIELPIKPVSEVVQIEVKDICNIARTLSRELYSLEDNILHFTHIPSCLTMKVHFFAGIASTDIDVPCEVKSALMEITGYLYETRGSGMPGNQQSNIGTFLDQYRHLKCFRL